MARILGIDQGPHAVRGTLLRTVLRRGEVLRYVEVPLVVPDDVAPDADPEERDRAARRAALADLVAQLDPPPDQIVAAVDGRSASLRSVEIPAAAQKRANEVLPFELEPLLPFQADEAVLDHQPVAREGPTLRLLTAAVHHDRLRDFLERLGEAGVDPKEVAVGGASLDGLAHLVPEMHVGTSVVLALGQNHADLCVLRDGRAAFARTVALRGSPFDERSPLELELRRSLAAWRANGGAPLERAWLTGFLPAPPAPPPTVAAPAAEGATGPGGGEPAAANGKDRTSGAIVSPEDDAPSTGADASSSGGTATVTLPAPADPDTTAARAADPAEAHPTETDADPAETGVLAEAPPTDDPAVAWLERVAGVETRRIPLPDARGADRGTRDRFGPATALAARTLDREKRLDLRRGPFAYTRTVGAVQRYARLAAIGTAAVLVAFAFATFARYRTLSDERARLVTELARVSDEVLGERTESPDRARELLERGAREDDPLPEVDALDFVEYVSARIPPEIPHTARTLLVELGEEGGEGRFELAGSVASIAERDQIAAAMEAHACLRELDRGSTSAAPGSDGRLRYQLEADVLCDADTGDDEDGDRRRGRRSRGRR